jgi:hypothetical protein
MSSAIVVITKEDYLKDAISSDELLGNNAGDGQHSKTTVVELFSLGFFGSFSVEA